MLSLTPVKKLVDLILMRIDEIKETDRQVREWEAQTPQQTVHAKYPTRSDLQCQSSPIRRTMLKRHLEQLSCKLRSDAKMLSTCSVIRGNASLPRAITSTVISPRIGESSSRKTACCSAVRSWNILIALKIPSSARIACCSRSFKIVLDFRKLLDTPSMGLLRLTATNLPGTLARSQQIGNCPPDGMQSLSKIRAGSSDRTHPRRSAEPSVSKSPRSRLSILMPCCMCLLEQL